MAPRFCDRNQHDSQEFLRFLLCGLSEDLADGVRRAAAPPPPPERDAPEPLPPVLVEGVPSPPLPPPPPPPTPLGALAARAEHEDDDGRDAWEMHFADRGGPVTRSCQGPHAASPRRGSRHFSLRISPLYNFATTVIVCA